MISATPPREENHGSIRVPRIYYAHPLLLGELALWRALFEHARALGFDTVLSAPLFARGEGASVFVSGSFDELDACLNMPGPAEAQIGSLARTAGEFGLRFMLDLVLDRVAQSRADERPDPRIPVEEIGSRNIRFEHDPDSSRHLAEWQQRVRRLVDAGVTGFRCIGIDRVPPHVWASMIEAGHASNGDVVFLAWTPGSSYERRRSLRGSGIAGTFSSLAWWDLEQSWLAEEYELQRQLGYQVSFPEAPYGKRVAHGVDSCEVRERRSLRALRLAGLTGTLMVPMGFEFGLAMPLDPMHGDGRGLRGLREQASFDLSAEIRSVNEGIAHDNGAFEQRPLRLVATTQSSAFALIRSDDEDLRSSKRIRAIVANRDLRHSAAAPMRSLNETVSAFLPLTLDQPRGRLLREPLRLRPGELLVLEGRAAAPILVGSTMTAKQAAARPRIAIENITPSVDGGRYPVKRVVGGLVRVEADIFGDGHDPLSASLIWREADAPDWQQTPMELAENDRWRADFPLRRLGRHQFAVEAWRNPFAVYRYELSKKHEARLNLTLELQEGLLLVREALEHAKGELAGRLGALLEQLLEAPESGRTEMLLSAETFRLMAEADRRPFRVRSEVMPIDAERAGAAFASWYELFPRSQSGDPNRHGTFKDVMRRLPKIREMGFDVVYFPPIHPIGKTNRKGRNNSLKGGPGDPGSPYAIGSEEGGHDAIHPELGTFEDFRDLIEAAEKCGLEIALDLAIQASPDHPWLKQKPGWFDWRPDGTIRYAENPPKKYEDIVNLDFYTKDAIPELWQTLRDIVQLWVDNGVKLFRVDNPHTKPFPFWEWLIADIRGRHPEVVFLSEAFTRPKVMYRLAKIGFSQSYTYFTWRNTRWEIEQYMRELTEEAPKNFFRPHFFVNTHDINPDYLQDAPRPAFLIRAALAATLSGLWGIYNGFELCEGRPDAKRKEYADSEKYEIRAWDWDRPGNIIPEIAMLNRIRNENSALHSHLGLTLLASSNDAVMFYEKASSGRENVLLIGVSLDPYSDQQSDVEVPLWFWDLPDDGILPLQDLVTGETFTWTGKWQRVHYNPSVLPFSIYRVR
ncbi:alpha-1,4-glucan--maltose-1-phosphate maltosyltransferase [Sinorhizobium meliloti]|uniref:alpha-1,4-glucan--maltose-1-phosphate maltosyltransferase n=1 Tax=Rhizobium meliloti TaxID=382 RepID=UPI000FD84E4F|nr:alpha-1,4-glucan--maltose-1-phosphate maltosyltransferase [Sinorhizobium meliloti]RVG00678.1 alpha-1,4-glucan--maltose-1-phosphate maltosyltransferase [Sinorhizobium meliloti]RVH46781.1 alpha-1,4-glucan--maltose-1-phosphate maltosyltransferase [Sinorhizobium meliloti]RVK16887.1 alpha-1,4-glucan--maltose-1-phosphate maltosyltransferase [Sinorhizobium meliloti]